jgi:FtsP/CotA-like multicopper oxidase with cupredoxin domain
MPLQRSVLVMVRPVLVLVFSALLLGGCVGAAPAQPPVTAAPPAAVPRDGPGTMQDVAGEPGRVEVSLTASRATLALVPGMATEVFAYNGQSPGPTLDVREGDRVVVRFRNDLPEPTTVHWHGLHIPFMADGSPFHPVAPGESYTYEFTVPYGSAGTYWYHPHPHHRTGYQVGRGLYGAVVVRSADDPLAHLPEQLLILSDNRLTQAGAIDMPGRETTAAVIDAENGREGDLIFVSGALLPTVRIRSGEVQRWRVINASGARVYRLAIPGHRLLHVGSDGGLFEHPVEVDEIVLANGERAELLVRGTGSAGDRVMLQALPYDRYVKQTRPTDWNRSRDLLTLEYAPGPRLAAQALPATLRRVPAIDTLHATARRVVVMTQGLLNGQLMDMDRVDMVASLGATEIWEIENLVGMDHPFHLHGFQFQLLDRNGVPEPQRQWKDTVNVPKHQVARFIVRFDNHPGKWMFHCHILTHEDDGMMGVLEIR